MVGVVGVDCVGRCGVVWREIPNSYVLRCGNMVLLKPHSRILNLAKPPSAHADIVEVGFEIFGLLEGEVG